MVGPQLNSPGEWGFRGIKEQRGCHGMTAKRKGSRQAVRLVATGNWWLLLACPVAVIWEGR